MASNVIALNPRNTKQRGTQSDTKYCGQAVIASFAQARAMRDLPRHLKAGVL